MSKTVGFYGGKFSPLHNGHVQLMVRASTMVDELHICVVSDDEWEKSELYAHSKVKFFDMKHRARWIKRIFKDHPHVHVHHVYQPVTNNVEEDWRIGSDNVKKVIGKNIDVVFSAVPEYDPFFKMNYPDAEHIVIDPERISVPVSSTFIRANGAYKCWDYLPQVVRSDMVFKVAVVGTESSGKSTLCKNLAALFNTTSVEEYGRTFMAEVGDKYTITEDYRRIALKHWLDVQDALPLANKVLIVDTEAIVTQNFSYLYEGFYQDIIEAVIGIQDYDLIIYLDHDVEWVDDGTRVFGSEEQRDTAAYGLESLLEKYNQNYVRINGSYTERLERAYLLVCDSLEG